MERRADDGGVSGDPDGSSEVIELGPVGRGELRLLLPCSRLRTPDEDVRGADVEKERPVVEWSADHDGPPADRDGRAERVFDPSVGGEELRLLRPTLRGGISDEDVRGPFDVGEQRILRMERRADDGIVPVDRNGCAELIATGAVGCEELRR